MYDLTSAKFNNSCTDNVQSSRQTQAVVYDMLPWRKLSESGAQGVSSRLHFKCLQWTLHKLTILFASNKFSSAGDLNLFPFYIYSIQIQNNDTMQSLRAHQQALMLICIVLQTPKQLYFKYILLSFHPHDHTMVKAFICTKHTQYLDILQIYMQIKQQPLAAGLGGSCSTVLKAYPEMKRQSMH